MKIVKTYTNFAAANFELGSYYLGSGSLKKAADCFKTVIRLRPRFYPAYHNLYQIYQQLGDLAGQRSVLPMIILLRSRIHPGDYTQKKLYLLRLIEE